MSSFFRLYRPGILKRLQVVYGPGIVERARALAPLIESRALQIDRERRIPDDVVDALFDAGLFRVLLRLSGTGPFPSRLVPFEFESGPFGLRCCQGPVGWGVSCLPL